MTDFFIDAAYSSVNKYGEELCGDSVEIIRLKDSVIIVMADGLGSGVKANILSTLTSKIASVMMKEGISIFDTVDTIVHTLPVCSIRKIAYSTFTLLKIYNDGRVYAAEYDNPPFFLIKDDSPVNVPKKETLINGKKVQESNFYLNDGDMLAVVSDGVIHAGVGAVLNLGWQWDNVLDYFMKLYGKENYAKNISSGIMEVCQNLYQYKPGDDATAVVVKITKPGIIDLFTGPPLDPENDSAVVKKLMEGRGKKIVCGGTAANIVARELNEEIKVNLDFIDPDVPPTARIKGIDLVTEGVLTLSKAVEKIKAYADLNLKECPANYFSKKDGASLLASMLVHDCTHLNLWVGKAVNPAHQNPDLPVDLSIKLKLVDELKEIMERLGKKVKLNFI